MNQLITPEEAQRVPTHKLGWPDLRFRVLEEVGEPMNIWFVRLQQDGTVVDQEYVKHENHDGIGAMTAIIEKRGGVLPTMPLVRHPRPGFLRRLFIFRRYVKRVLPGFPARWKQTPDWSILGAGPASSIALLSEDATEALRVRSKEEGASSTTALLSALDRCSAERLLEPGSPRAWFIPVNVRERGRSYGNRAAAMLLPFAGPATPAEIHATFKEFLAAGFHWGATVPGAFMKFLSVERHRRMASYVNPNRIVLGSVTNVGVWPPSDGTLPEDDDKDSVWCVIPPTNRRLPINCALITYRGKMSIALTCHGSLRMTNEEVRSLLEAAMAELKVDANVFVGPQRDAL